jgi:hypothetical protein
VIPVLPLREALLSGAICLSSILRVAIEEASGLAQSRQVTLTPVPGDMGLVLGDQDLLTRFTIGESVTPGWDLGLGPSMAFRIVSLFGGSVMIENQVPAGIRLTAVLRNSLSSNRSS